MEFPFTLPGYPEVPLILRFGLLGSRKIIYQGKPLLKIRWNQRKYILQLSDWVELKLELKPQSLNFFVPDVVYNGQVIRVTPVLPAYQIIIIYLPLLWVFFAVASIGGAFSGGLAGLFGALAVETNLRIFYDTQTVVVKVVRSLIVLLASILFWLIAATLLSLLLENKHGYLSSYIWFVLKNTP